MNVPELFKLLKGGADPNAPQAQLPGLRPLHAAVNTIEDGAGVEILSLLIEHGASVNSWNAERDVTPLLMAVMAGQRLAVDLLLKAGADPNVRSSEGDSPLRICAAAGDLGTAALLLNAGAGKTINEWGGTAGYTALGLAASKIDLAMLTLLLEAGADPRALDEDGRTARERLPARDASNATAWNTAFQLLR